MIEFEDIMQLTIPYGVVGLRNGGMACFNDTTKKKIMDFIKEQVRPGNWVSK